MLTIAASYLFAGKPQLSDITHDKTEMTLCTYSNTESPHQSQSQSLLLLELDSLLDFLIKLVIQFINCFPSIQVFFPLNLHWLLSCWTKTTHTAAAVVNKCLTESKQKKSVFAPRGLWKHFFVGSLSQALIYRHQCHGWLFWKGEHTWNHKNQNWHKLWHMMLASWQLSAFLMIWIYPFKVLG